MTDQMRWNGRTRTWDRINQYGQLVPDEPEPTTGRLEIVGPLRNDDSDERGGVRPTRVIRELRDIGPVDELHIYIDSEGGHTSAMTAIANAVTRHPAKQVITHCFGRAWSAAGFLFLLGHRREMTPHASLMLHHVHRSGDTTPQDCRLLSDAILDLWAERLPHIDRRQIREWQAAETAFTAATAWGAQLATDIDLNTQDREYDISMFATPARSTTFPATREFEQRIARQQTPAAVSRLKVEVPPLSIVRNRDDYESLRTRATALRSRKDSVATAELAVLRPVLQAARRVFPIVNRISNYATEPSEFILSGPIGDVETDAMAFARFLRANATNKVTLKINSSDGSIWDAFAISNLISSHSPGVTTEVIGVAQGPAAIVAIAGSKVRMRANATMSLSQSEALVHGNRDAIADGIRWLDSVDFAIAETIRARTGRTLDTVKSWMSDSKIFNAQSALSNKLIDEVIPLKSANN